jgi:pimeloyl-ACP methyl ester carboxylesterase
VLWRKLDRIRAMTDRVVLLHGLWMPGLAMRTLAARLRGEGFAPEVFAYRSIVGGPQATMAQLAKVLEAAPAHVVAHSLGGLIALETLAAHPELPVRRTVCLGTPLCGSRAANRLARWRATSAYLGRNAALLRRGCAEWPAVVPVGMIAGSVPRGLGALVAGFEGVHDGTVAVAETRHGALADHIVVAASHSGLLLSVQAARQAATFLRQGRFAHRAGDATTASDGSPR